jgi:hypothetical protein
LNALFCTSFSILAFFGLRRTLRDHKPIAWLYAVVLVFFPLIYYITSPHLRFRHPLDPQIVLLATYAVIKQP